MNIVLTHFIITNVFRY